MSDTDWFYDNVTSGVGEGPPRPPTAVGAATPPPFDDLFAVIERMTQTELARFCYRLRQLTIARHVPGTDDSGVFWTPDAGDSEVRP